jgi:riboflavin kinase
VADHIANLPDSALDPLNQLGLTGIFFGFARIHPSVDTPLPTALPTAAPSPEGRAHPVRQLSDLQPGAMLGLSSSGKKVLANPLDAAAISALPAHTAPYPANSSPGMEGDEKRRLMENDGKVWPMVMSVGYNPYFKNEKVTAVSSGSFGIGEVYMNELTG